MSQVHQNTPDPFNPSQLNSDNDQPFQKPPHSRIRLSKQAKRLLVGGGIFLVFALGTVAVTLLSRSSLDVRQRATETTVTTGPTTFAKLQITTQRGGQSVEVHNYSGLQNESGVKNLIDQAESSIVSGPEFAAFTDKDRTEYFGTEDVLILTKHYIAWIKNTSTPLYIANRAGKGGGSLMGLWILDGNNANPNFKYRSASGVPQNRLGRNNYLASTGCAMLMQLNTKEDTGEAFFSAFSTNSKRSGTTFPVTNIDSPTGKANRYTFEGSMRKVIGGEENTVGPNQTTAAFTVSYLVNNDSPLVTINPTLSFDKDVPNVAALMYVCDTNIYQSNLYYVAADTNAYHRFLTNWYNSEDASFLANGLGKLSIVRYRKASESNVEPVKKDFAFRDLIAFSNAFSTNQPPVGRNPTDYLKVFEVNRRFVNGIISAGTPFEWKVNDVLSGEESWSSTALTENGDLSGQNMVYRVKKFQNRNQDPANGSSGWVRFTGGITDYPIPEPLTLPRNSPIDYDPQEKDPGVTGFQVELWHSQVAGTASASWTDADGNQVNEIGKKTFRAGKIWDFTWQIGEVADLKDRLIARYQNVPTAIWTPPLNPPTCLLSVNGALAGENPIVSSGPLSLSATSTGGAEEKMDFQLFYRLVDTPQNVLGFTRITQSFDRPITNFRWTPPAELQRRPFTIVCNATNQANRSCTGNPLCTSFPCNNFSDCGSSDRAEITRSLSGINLPENPTPTPPPRAECALVVNGQLAQPNRIINVPKGSPIRANASAMTRGTPVRTEIYISPLEPRNSWIRTPGQFAQGSSPQELTWTPSKAGRYYVVCNQGVRQSDGKIISCTGNPWCEGNKCAGFSDCGNMDKIILNVTE